MNYLYNNSDHLKTSKLKYSGDIDDVIILASGLEEHDERLYQFKN